MSALSRIMLTTILIVPLSACGSRFFSERKDNPVTEDYLSKTWFQPAEYGLLSTMSERRLVLVDFDNHMYCSEPSPDVAGAIAHNKRLSAEAKLGTDEKTGAKSGSLEYESNFSLAVAGLIARTQGLQWARDRELTLCTLYMQKALTKEAYLAQLDKIRSDSKELIASELENRPAVLGVLSTKAPKTGRKDPKKSSEETPASSTPTAPSTTAPK